MCVPQRAGQVDRDWRLETDNRKFLKAASGHRLLDRLDLMTRDNVKTLIPTAARSKRSVRLVAH